MFAEPASFLWFTCSFGEQLAASGMRVPVIYLPVPVPCLRIPTEFQAKEHKARAEEAGGENNLGRVAAGK